MIHSIARWCFREFRRQLWTIILACVTITLCAGTCYLIVWPAYKNPIARMYTSRLGYAAVLRKSGQPFPVKTAAALRRDVEVRFIGEGLVQSEPVQVPMIAMARILKVNAEEGDRVRAGDVLVELDETRIKIKIAAANAELETAKAEYERVRIGSVNVLEKERPDRDRIRLKAVERETQILNRLTNIYDKLGKENAVSMEKVLEQELEAVRSYAAYQELKLGIDVAEEGLENSLEIAEISIREAALQVEHRESELDDYKSLAPADGVVERVLVHAGEYNQDPGRPAILLAVGRWFELYLDQTALGQVDVGAKVEVRLAAFQDRVFQGTISKVRPLVNFSLGGPETNRPIRPLGTGAPEWPATFAVRVTFDEPSELIVPGLTGFGRVVMRRTNLCVPRGAVTGVSGNRGILFVVTDDGTSCSPRNVTFGTTDEDWTEILDGIAEGEIVVVDGYQVLEPGDAISSERMDHTQADANALAIR
jgi:HlyD family secretion protein